MKHSRMKYQAFRNVFYKVFIYIFTMAEFSLGDVYLHNPRGSNNRLSESSTERANNNRLFDSQNNNRGGYNIGGLNYYAGSSLRIEWTNQHSCQNPNNNCEIILQYMCSDGIRDGVTIKTIPIDNQRCQKNNCDEDYSYGMNEDQYYYQNCLSRQRNKGLFTADQVLRGESAIYTRQNPTGTRSGLECPEERDYYPYWHPSPWKDIAVLTNNVDRCEYYKQESENVKPRYWCYFPKEVLNDIGRRGMVIPSTKSECMSFTYYDNNSSEITGIWMMNEAHNIPPPECRETEFTMDNHLGNTLDGFPPSFQWTLPKLYNVNCVLRIRYNISTMDYDGWNPEVNSSLNDRSGSFVLQRFENLPKDELQKRGYSLRTDSQVKMFPELDIGLNLAVNTDQYGRVFEDRSHVFTITKRPEHVLSTDIIHNLNVQGKRGNIVQVYPAVEYDFNPKTLEVTTNDHIHIQWTGSNSNPIQNDGIGQLGTDRSNLVPLADSSYSLHTVQINGHWGCNYPIENVTRNSFLGFPEEDIEELAFLGSSGDIANLNDASPNFDLELKQVKENGEFYYFCTRNNNFSNRDQKGRIIVTNARVISKLIGRTGGSIILGSTSITVKEDIFPKLEKLRIEEWKKKDVESNPRFRKYQDTLKKDLASNILVIFPEEHLTLPNTTMEVRIPVSASLGKDLSIYRSSSSNFLLWQRIPTEIVGNDAVFQTDRGGVYLARKQTKSTAIIAAVLIVVALILIASGLVAYFRRYPKHWKEIVHSMKRKSTSQ